jgi:hypothetical protein
MKSKIDKSYLAGYLLNHWSTDNTGLKFVNNNLFPTTFTSEQILPDPCLRRLQMLENPEYIRLSFILGLA